MSQSNTHPFIAPAEGAERLKVAKTAFRGLIHDRLYPQPVKFNKRVLRIPLAEAEQVEAAYAAGLSQTQIRALVDRLHAQRKERAALFIAQITS